MTDPIAGLFLGVVALVAVGIPLVWLVSRVLCSASSGPRRPGSARRPCSGGTSRRGPRPRGTRRPGAP